MRTCGWVRRVEGLGARSREAAERERKR